MLNLFDFLFLPLAVVIMLLILALPLIFIYLFLRLSETAFEMVGFSHWHASLAVFGSVLGSLVDFPINAAPITSYPSWYVSLVSLNSLDVSNTFHPLYLAVNLGWMHHSAGHFSSSSAARPGISRQSPNRDDSCGSRNLLCGRGHSWRGHRSPLLAIPLFLLLSLGWS